MSTAIGKMSLEETIAIPQTQPRKKKKKVTFLLKFSAFFAVYGGLDISINKCLIKKSLGIKCLEFDFTYAIQF